MEEYSNDVCYEAPELRVTRVVRGGLVASAPHLVGVANESFQSGNCVWGGVSGDMSAESFQGASNAWGDGLGAGGPGGGAPVEGFSVSDDMGW